MKNKIAILICLVEIILLLSACGRNTMTDISKADNTKKVVDKTYEITIQPESDIDVDLTQLSSTMVYSEVYNMLCEPENYIGKTVKMCGTFVIYSNEDQSQFYPAVIIADATACCSQGLEFVLAQDSSGVESYPELESQITVVGTFETYEEDGGIYCRLGNARILL